MDFDELMLKKLSGSKQALPLPEPSNDQNQVNLMDVDIPPPLQSNQRSKKTLGLKGPLASMRPRVKCSQCDFTGKEGQEMRGHVEKKHKTEFKCKECDFVTKNKVLQRQHMKSTHGKKKCESCPYHILPHFESSFSSFSILILFSVISFSNLPIFTVRLSFASKSLSSSQLSFPVSVSQVLHT